MYIEKQVSTANDFSSLKHAAHSAHKYIIIILCLLN